MTKYEQNIINRIEELILEGKVSNDFLISNLKLSVSYLNLKRVSDYAKSEGKSTQGLRGSKKIIKICDYQSLLIMTNQKTKKLINLKPNNHVRKHKKIK